MKRLVALLVGLVTVVAVRAANATKPLETDASLGFALPLGSLERGSRISDTTWGNVPIELDGAWFFAPRIGLHGAFSYAVGIPKLCASTRDCEASLGHDVAIELGVRFAPPDLGVLSPRLDAGIGWEWYGASLADNGAVSSRAYSGPTFLALAFSAPLVLSKRFAIGPTLGVRAGVFSSSTRQTPAWTETSLDGTAIHAWLRIAIDARLTF